MPNAIRATTTLLDTWKDVNKTLVGLRQGKIKPAAAKEMNNAAGKQIAIAKQHLDFAKLAHAEPTPEFFSPTAQALAAKKATLGK